MSIEVSGTDLTFAGNSTSISSTHTLGDGAGKNRIVIVAINNDNSENPSGVTYNGVAMTPLITLTQGILLGKIYYILDADLPASAGDYTVTITLGTARLCAASCQARTNVSQAAPAYGSWKGNKKTGTYSATVSATDSNSVVLAYASGSNNGINIDGAGDTVEQWQNTASGTTLWHGKNSTPAAGSNTVSMYFYLTVFQDCYIIGLALDWDEAPVSGYVPHILIY